MSDEETPVGEILTGVLVFLIILSLFATSYWYISKVQKKKTAGTEGALKGIISPVEAYEIRRGYYVKFAVKGASVPFETGLKPLMVWDTSNRIILGFISKAKIKFGAGSLKLEYGGKEYDYACRVWSDVAGGSNTNVQILTCSYRGYVGGLVYESVFYGFYDKKSGKMSGDGYIKLSLES